MKWTKEDLEKAVELIKSGLTYAEIGAELNRGAYSVKMKLQKSGIKYFQFHEKQSIFETRTCLNCDSSFETRKSYPDKFCGHSCSAKFNNSKRILVAKTENAPISEINKRRREYYHANKNKKCLNCNTDSMNTFCTSSCKKAHRKKQTIAKTEYNRKEKFALIESGDTSLKPRWLKMYLINLHGNKCMRCSWCEVNPVSGKVPVELEHVDGNSENNNLDNLKLLCPNCHSLTPTYKALNKGNGRHSRMDRYNQGKSF